MYLTSFKRLYGVFLYIVHNTTATRRKNIPKSKEKKTKESIQKQEIKETLKMSNCLQLYFTAISTLEDLYKKWNEFGKANISCGAYTRFSTLLLYSISSQIKKTHADIHGKTQTKTFFMKLKWFQRHLWIIRSATLLNTLFQSIQPWFNRN